MTLSRSDRPYGQFPRGDVPEAAPAPETPRRVPLRERVVARLRAPLALLALLALSWFLVSAVQTGGIAALRARQEQPTPAPTPQLAAAIYAHVAPSVVQVSAKSASGEIASRRARTGARLASNPATLAHATRTRHDNAPITQTHTPTRTAAPSDWDGRQNQRPRQFFGEKRAGIDPRRVAHAHPVNTHSVRARV